MQSGIKWVGGVWNLQQSCVYVGGKWLREGCPGQYAIMDYEERGDWRG